MKCEECNKEIDNSCVYWGIHERTLSGKDIFHYYCSKKCAYKARSSFEKTHKEIKQVTDLVYIT